MRRRVRLGAFRETGGGEGGKGRASPIGVGGQCVVHLLESSVPTTLTDPHQRQRASFPESLSAPSTLIFPQQLPTRSLNPAILDAAIGRS